MKLRRSSGDRRRFLSAWAQRLRQIVAKGLIDDERKRQRALARGNVLRDIEVINGPRVAGLRIGFKMGKDGDRVVSFLEKHDYLMLRQTFPDENTYPNSINMREDPVKGWYGSKYTIYMPWDDRLAEKNIQTQTLLTESIAEQIVGSGTEWIAGLEESYSPVILSLDSHRGSQHYFVAGATGAGKSWFVRSMVAQLSMSPKNKFVLIDVSEKIGEGFGKIIPRLSSLIGPAALDLDTARSALVWLKEEMSRRFESGKWDSRIIIWIDEIPAIKEDEHCATLIKALVTRGRACDYHLVMCSQHVTEKELGQFSGLIKANVLGRIAFSVGTLAGSVESIYDSSALHLMVPGDCYVRHPNLSRIRLQASYFPDTFLKSHWKTGAPLMEKWPMVSLVDVETHAGNGFTPEQISMAVQIRMLGRAAGETRGYGRTIIQAETGVNQYQSTKLVEFADQILDRLARLKVS